MPHVLRASRQRHDAQIDELVFARDDDGNVTGRVHVNEPVELSGEQLSQAQEEAARYGLTVEEVSDEEAAELTAQQGVAADTATQAPVVESTGENSATVDQQTTENAERDAQAQEPNA